MQVRELDVKFIKFLLNLKAINYLKNTAKDTTTGNRYDTLEIFA